MLSCVDFLCVTILGMPGCHDYIIDPWRHPWHSGQSLKYIQNGVHLSCIFWKLLILSALHLPIEPVPLSPFSYIKHWFWGWVHRYLPTCMYVYYICDYLSMYTLCQNEGESSLIPIHFRRVLSIVVSKAVQLYQHDSPAITSGAFRSWTHPTVQSHPHFRLIYDQISNHLSQMEDGLPLTSSPTTSLLCITIDSDSGYSNTFKRNLMLTRSIFSAIKGEIMRKFLLVWTRSGITKGAIFPAQCIIILLWKYVTSFTWLCVTYTGRQ